LAVAAVGPAQARARNGEQPQVSAFSSARDCFANPDQLTDLDAYSGQSQAVSIAAGCEQEALRQTRRPPSVLQLSYAYYHAAKANRLRAEAGLERGDPAAAGLLNEAERQFNAAQSINPNLREAPLELARLHRLQGRYDEAREELNRISVVRPGEPAVSFEQAQVLLGRARQRGQSPEAAASLRDGALDFLSAFGNAGLAASAYVTYRGPLQLAQLANDLGKDALTKEPLTPEQAGEAVKRFERGKMAVDVLEDQGRARNARLIDPALAAEIYFNLGRAKLRQAAPAAAGADSSGCGSLERPSGFLLEELQRTFLAAQQRGSRDANWGLGCVQLARGDYRSAIGLFQAALPQPNTPSVLPAAEYQLALARALVRSQGTAADPNVQRAAVASYNAALAQSEPSRRVAVQLELARTYNDWGMLNEALAGLSRAVGASLDTDFDPSGDLNPIPDAYLLRGEILERRGDRAAAQANYLAAASTPWKGRAQAYHRLSLLQDRGQLAVQYATDAFLNASEDNERRTFRRSACLMRIVHDLTADQGQFYCSAEPRDDPDSLFYEGVFWMREAYRERGGNQRRNWAQALRAFETGLNNAGPGDTHVVRGQSYALRSTLTYGRRFALHCAGLGEANAAEEGDAASERERNLFTIGLGLGRCFR